MKALFAADDIGELAPCAIPTLQVEVGADAQAGHWHSHRTVATRESGS
jgi:hypothetical protein